MGAARRTAGESGIAAAVLFAVGSAIWGLDMPDGGAPTAEVVDFYRDTADRIVIGASLSLLALALFIVFAAAFRQVLVEAGGYEFLATAAFGGAMLGLAAGLVAESVNMVGGLRAQEGELSGSLARSVFEISHILGSTAAGVGFGVFALATAAIALGTGRVLPRWVAVVTLVLGVVLLSPVSHVKEASGAAVVVLGLLISVPLLRSGDPAPE